MFEGVGALDAPLLGNVDGAGLLLLLAVLGSVFATGSGLGSHGNVFVLVELRRFCQPYRHLSVTV